MRMLLVYASGRVRRMMVVISARSWRMVVDLRGGALRMRSFTRKALEWMVLRVWRIARRRLVIGIFVALDRVLRVVWRR